VDRGLLVSKYPRLFHMATAGSWPSIQEHGLWTTDQIAQTSGLSKEVIAQLAGQHRPQSVVLEHPTLGSVTIRDQKALRPVFARDLIVDMTLEEWVQVLNGRVFFWLHPKRLAGLLSAKAYKTLEQDVIVLDTASLVAAHVDRIELSPMNSGATIQRTNPTRGSMTFQSIDEYPWLERRKGRADHTAVAELCVVGGVSDLATHAVAVQRWRGDTLIGERPL
jgi:hypothetical protein